MLGPFRNASLLYILPLPEGRMGIGWEPSESAKYLSSLLAYAVSLNTPPPLFSSPFRASSFKVLN
jgi:hypothetical protein